MNCYGHVGPWAQRPGWDQLGAVATGLAMRQGSPARPRLLPGVAALDYTTGYLAAYGAMVALSRRAVEGGSWEVRASLSQTAMWMQQQPNVQPRLGAGRTWGVESENRPQRGQFLPDLQAHSPAMGQKDGEKWTAAVDLQPTIPKFGRLLGTVAFLTAEFLTMIS